MKENSIPVQGVFWVVNGKLFAFPFDNKKYPEGFARAGDTYAHKKLWESVRPKKCDKPYNYYPRGRVNITRSGKVQIFVSPHIGENILSEIIRVFGISDETQVIYDHSAHYKCHLDDEWR